MFKKMLSIVALAAAAFTFGLQQAAAQSFDMKAGPIYSNDEAKTKCVAACTLAWNNAWVTKVENVMSICSGFNQLKAADGKNYVIMDSNGGLEAGPIFSNAEAQTKCPNALKNVKWNGNWKTTEVNKMSVCGCTGTAVPWRPNVNEK